MKINKANLFAMVLCFSTLAFIICVVTTQPLPLLAVVIPTLGMTCLFIVFANEFVLEIKNKFSKKY